MTSYTPTEDQQRVIDHDGHAFITACPGAGKTRTMVERARRSLRQSADRRGVAFLSFTNAAVDELEARLRAFGAMPVPLFPSFIGTFDRFLWQFLVCPFGVPNCKHVPKLFPDKDNWEVKPSYKGAHALPLKCFDRITGKADAVLAKKKGFNVQERSINAHEGLARSIIASAREYGRLDFEDVRICVSERLSDTAFATRVGTALAARFREIVVDEAQDCNPGDLAVIEWLRQAGIAIKIICDPHQAIYGFRGGVTTELHQFAATFDEGDRLQLSDNFRSTPAICAAIAKFRLSGTSSDADRPMGHGRLDPTPVHILSYSGKGVPARIGVAFRELIEVFKIPLHEAFVLSATQASAAKAIGLPPVKAGAHLTLLLAEATMSYHFSFALGRRKEALVSLHRVILIVVGRIATPGDYLDYLISKGLEHGGWRPKIIELAHSLRFQDSDTPADWLQRARSVLSPFVAGSLNINQRLRNHNKLASILASAAHASCPARTIHSVKGLEFPAVCVVLTSKTFGRILDFLEGIGSPDTEEESRKIYVAASRAERLLAIAVPKGHASRLEALLSNADYPVMCIQV